MARFAWFNLFPAMVLGTIAVLPVSSKAGEITAELPGGAMVEFVWIEPGTFVMGSTDDQEQLLRDKGMWNDVFKDEHPPHEVTISQGFYLGKYEITQGQWERVMGAQPWSGLQLVQNNPDHPAVYITREDVQAFITHLERGSGRGTLPSAHGSRVGVCLPGGHHDAVVVRGRRETASGLRLV